MTRAPGLSKPQVGRRTVLAAAGAFLLAACGAQFDGQRLTITTGSAGAVYDQLGQALAASWAAEFGFQAQVLTSAGSGQNLDRLLVGAADVGICAADAAATRAAESGGGRLRALARMHDDYVQLVVPADSAIVRPADLRGRRVSVGPPDSGVRLIADRTLSVLGLSGEADLQRCELAVDAAADALWRREIDAFFWSGGLPTEQVSALARLLPIRVVDLAEVLPVLFEEYEVYQPATLPASPYRLPKAVTTLLVPNLLLVSDRMSATIAEALTGGVFEAQAALAAANHAARSIDVRSGIETVPILLHPGAEAYYRSAHYTRD